MSRTYDIVCHDCKVALWIGQGWPETRVYIYTTECHIQALETFLFAHQRHKLEFGDDEHMGLDYLQLDATEDAAETELSATESQEVENVQ